MPDFTDAQSADPEYPLPWQLNVWDKITKKYLAEQLAHAYLIQGPAGIGKKEFALALSRYMLCQDPKANRACGGCANCILGRVGQHPDLFHLSLEEGSKELKVDQIRALSDFVNRTSHAGGAKVIVIETAHRMNANAANALLKTLEEPSKKTFLFLVSELPGKLKATIRSRCQPLPLQRPDVEVASQWLEEFLPQDEVLEYLTAANGSPLLALQYKSTGMLDARKDFAAALYSSLQGKNSIQGVATLTSKQGELESIGHFLWTLSILIKSLATNAAEVGENLRQGSAERDERRESTEGTDSINLIMDLLKDITHDRVYLVKELLKMQVAVNDARDKLLSSSNPNAQLLMESLLWRWATFPTLMSA